MTCQMLLLPMNQRSVRLRQGSHGQNENGDSSLRLSTTSPPSNQNTARYQHPNRSEQEPQQFGSELKEKTFRSYFPPPPRKNNPKSSRPNPRRAFTTKKRRPGQALQQVAVIDQEPTAICRSEGAICSSVTWTN